MTLVLLFCAALLLAWSNGANDNQKGVATLRGSGALTPRQASWLGNGATCLGSLVSIFLAGTLAQAFQGQGIVADNLLAAPAHLAVVGGAAAITIGLATRMGLPTSTTHALVGALVGAGLVLSPDPLHWSVLASKFAAPLLVSPIVAVALTVPIAWLVSRSRSSSGPEGAPAPCVCLQSPPGYAALPGGALGFASALPQVTLGTSAECATRPRVVAALSAPRAVTALHVVSGATVCFARALNDTPKIAALLLGGALIGAPHTFAVVALAMVLGGLLRSESVARTMSERITDMDQKEGLTANLATAGLVLWASKLGVPVSTTHVSCGSLFGIGLATGKARWATIAGILGAWVLTLPLAAGLAMGCAWIVTRLG